MEEEKKHLVEGVHDVVGENVETLLALVLKLLPDNLGRFGVANGIVVSGKQYKYNLLIVSEDHEDFDKIQLE